MADQATLSENKATVERFFEDVFNSKQYDVIEETVTSDTINHDPPGADGQLTGRDAAEGYFKGLHEAFPDLHADIEQLVAEDDYLTARVTYTGTHEGTFMEIPATGEHVTVEGLVMYRMENGKIAETWGKIDAVSLMKQVGAL